MDNMIIVGFMGAGKTTVSRKIGHLLSREILDLDTLLEQELAESIGTIFKTKGEAYFREQEYQLLKQYHCKPSVISTGGGIVTYEPSFDLLKECKNVVYLEASFETLYNRLLSDGTQHRPLVIGQSKEKVKDLFNSRQEKYRQVATCTVVTDDLSIDEIANFLIEV